MAGLPVPSPPQAIQEFLETEDLTLLEKALRFEKDPAFNNYQCCTGCCAGLASVGITCFFCPIATCYPCALYKYFDLKLDKDSVQLSSAGNDCCCHVGTSVKTVPLEKVQDVELSNDWIQTMFGVQLVSVQTAGTGGINAEIQAAFLKEPAQVREAILLAVKLRHAREASPPAQHPGMQRAGGAGQQGELARRLQRLQQAVAKGVLTEQEALSARAGLLASEHDVTPLLLEAAALVGQGLLTPQDFATMKARWLAVAAA